MQSFFQRITFQQNPKRCLYSNSFERPFGSTGTCINDNFPYIYGKKNRLKKGLGFFLVEHGHAIRFNTPWQHYATVILSSVKKTN